MKATVKQLAIVTFTALFLMTINVNAEGTEIKASASNENIETSLQLENWMTDDSFWNTKTASFAVFTEETDASLELENWMTDTEIWNVSFEIETEAEESLELQDWMFNEATWNFDLTEKEPALQLETWMTNSIIWK